MTRWWIRADASGQIGLGHVMRCVAIAEEVVSHGLEVCFVLADPSHVVVGILARRGFATVVVPDAHDSGWSEVLRAGDVVVFDGYHLTAADWAVARAAGSTVIVVDDSGITEADVDLIVNPDPLPDSPALDAPRLLAGPRYALVRREFRARRRRRG